MRDWGGGWFGAGREGSPSTPGTLTPTHPSPLHCLGHVRPPTRSVNPLIPVPPQPGTPQSPFRGCGGLVLPACCSPGSSGYRKRPGPFLDSKPQPQPLGAAQSARQGNKPLLSVFQTPIGFFPLCRPREAVCGLSLLGAVAEAWAGWVREDVDLTPRHGTGAGRALLRPDPRLHVLCVCVCPRSSPAGLSAAVPPAQFHRAPSSLLCCGDGEARGWGLPGFAPLPSSLSFLSAPLHPSASEPLWLHPGAPEFGFGGWGQVLYSFGGG